MQFCIFAINRTIYTIINMLNITIQPVTQNDINTLFHISRQTFIDAFAALNTEENMAKYLEEELSLEKLTVELENENSAFYFALLGNDIIGYMKLNFGQAQKELQENTSLEVERIYVLKEFIGKNVGQMLYEKALAIASEKNVDFIWLGVWEENVRAIKFYERNGFVAFDKHEFVLGDDVQMDVMMKLDFKSE